ncbi:DUF2358-containing protein [Fragilaria crotonensis]|nr:DUF2358-containing protein [Fragilaria crotonensis]
MLPHSSTGFAPAIPVRVHRGHCYDTHRGRCLLPRLDLTNEERNEDQNVSEVVTDIDDVGVQKDMNLFTRASWYGVEAFGKLFGKASQSQQGNDIPSSATLDLTVPPLSLQETLDRIRLDTDRSYFLSGQVDTFIYDEDCLFADPFVSFRGRDRFVDNLQNLGSFITKYSAKLLEYSSSDGNSQVNTKLMVKLELNLPWKPVLAWPWGVTYIIDTDTFLVTKHIESWDIDPFEGVKQIFRKPRTQVK